MRTLLSILILVLSTTLFYGQNSLSIELIEKPSNILSDPDHYYLVDLKNNSNVQYNNLTITVKSVSCVENVKSVLYKDYVYYRTSLSASNSNNQVTTSQSYQVTPISDSNLNFSILERDKTTFINNLNLNGNSSAVFYVKSTIKNNSTLNTSNCFEIVVTSSDGATVLSNKLSIEQLIPDPKDFD